MVPHSLSLTPEDMQSVIFKKWECSSCISSYSYFMYNYNYANKDTLITLAVSIIDADAKCY